MNFTMWLPFLMGSIVSLLSIHDVNCMCNPVYTEDSPCVGRPQLITWYTYDVSKNTCVNATYKGCGGVGNLFDNKEECQNRCIYNTSSVCTSLHVLTSDMCRRVDAYHYDFNAEECSKVFADTCKWNGTTLFLAEEACTRTCGLNGEWTSWSAWGSCVPICRSNGYRYRSRYQDCINPVPRFGGKPCKGPNIEFQECHDCIHDAPIVTYDGKILSLSYNKTKEEISYYQTRINIDGNRAIIIRDRIVISVPENFELLVNLINMNIVGNTNYNFVKIYDVTGGTKTETIRYTTSGNSSLISTSRITEIYVQQTETTWFNASVLMIPAECRNYFGDHKGEISIPSFNGNLPHNYDCEYIIESEEKGFLTIHLLNMYLVNGDHLKIYGNYPEDLSLIFSLPEGAEESEENLTLTLYGNVFRIHIHTDFVKHSKLSFLNYEVTIPKESSECISSFSIYGGVMNVTSSGAACLPWRNFLGKESSVNFPNNFCRPYNNSTMPVCYVDTMGNFQSCNVTECPVKELIKPVGVGNGNDGLETNKEDEVSSGAAENQTILMVVAGSALLTMVASVFGIVFRSRCKKNRPIDTLQVVAEGQSVSSVHVVNLNISEGTAAYSVARDSQNISKSGANPERKRGNYEYAAISNGNNEEEDDYACVENIAISADKEADNAETDLDIDTDYAVLSDERKRNSDKSECKYVEVGEAEYDILRGSREIISNVNNDNVYGDDTDIYAESHRESASENFDKSDYGVGIPLNITRNETPHE